MTSIRVRDPIEKDPPEFTIEFLSEMGSGCWWVLENGHLRTAHDWKWQARRARKRLMAIRD